MDAGILIVETSEQQPGLVRVYSQTRAPPEPAAGSEPRIRYMARFDDADAALMHAHQALHHHLVDLGTRTYRADLVTAIAAVEAIGFGHQRAYLDPTLDEFLQARIATEVTRRVTHRQRRNRLWTLLGRIALALLIAHALAGLL